MRRRKREARSPVAEAGDELVRGRCLCGAVRFAAAPIGLEMEACHCSMCRRWAGGVGIYRDVSSLRFDDEAALGVYRSSEWGERLFCRICGSSLAWRMISGEFITVAAAALDGAEALPLTGEIFIDDKPAGYAFANATSKRTGAEIAAVIAARQQGRMDG